MLQDDATFKALCALLSAARGQLLFWALCQFSPPLTFSHTTCFITTFYQPTRVLLNKTPTRLREHNCLAKDGPLHSYGGCDGVVVSFLYSGVICVGVSVVYTRGCIGFCNVCLFSLPRSVDYVMECAGYCRMYLFAHSRATHGVILVGCRRVC